jgi:hypothetical protein
MGNNTGAPSRYEINQAVRSVLTRHSIDIEALSVSSSASLVYLNGLLKKAMGKDLKPIDIDVLFREIERIPWVRGIIAELENWVVTGIDGSWLAVAKRGSLRPTAASAGQEDYRIEKDEKITDVLDDIKKKED